ncbi:MAG: hypothetical protein ABW352_22885 [Polyangiales bacterium]
MRRTIRVLVVVDGGVNHARLAGFGVGRFIELLRSTTLGCTTFSVDVAERGELDFVDHGPGGGDHLRYESFRFDSQIGRERVLDRYQEAFLFGINPGELGIPVTPIGEAERTAILSWMDAGNGIFATGDHENLGANLASGIPRVRSMRRWTAADGVPTVEGPTRLDTNQPETPAEYAGTAQIARDAEEDAIPQPLRWIPVSRYRSGWTEVRRPHEILCHPLHGPIDVMPDHPHEGTCFTTAEISGHARRRADFPGSELPQVIAQGFVVPDPPFQHHKGDVPASTIQMVSVYDGWKENVGRVVVDSTWHHWFNLNLAGIEAAGGVNWDKISRYFVNVAKWIAPPGAYRARCWWELLDSHFRYPGIEEFHPKASVLELGNGLRDSLVRLHGACTVRMLALDSICEIAPELCHGLRERFERPEPPGCLTCPPIELIERVVLGGFVRGTMPIAARVHESIREGKRVELSAKDIGTAAMAGAEAALKELRTEVLGSLRSVEKMFAPLEAARQ